MKFKYMSLETGELYTSLAHAIITIIRDMYYYPKCRTWKMFRITHAC